MHRPLLALVVLAVLTALLPPRAAHADDGYRTEMAIVDGASLAVIGGSYLVPRSRVRTVTMLAGLLGLGLGATVVHASHDEDRRALLSATLRYVIPGVVTTGFLGYYALCKLGRAADKGDGKPCLSSNVAFAVIGLTFVAGVALDYAQVGRGANAQPRVLSFGGRF